jgi:transcriptional regulator with XRE-family HTH domain
MSKENPQYIATSLWAKAARKSMKLTQKELAEMLKISKKSLENYESGRIDMPMATAIKLATFCGFSPPFFNPPPEGRLQNRDVKGDKAGDKGMEITTAKYISLLEETVELQRWQIEANKVEWEKYKILEEAIRTQGEKVKKQIETEVKKILTKPRTSKKK